MSQGDQTSCDAVILGGGIAGASVAAHLAPHMKVALLEREPHLAMHATGRSAAMFVPSYGGCEAQALTAASEAYFHAANDEAAPLFRPRPALHVARDDQADQLRGLAEPPLTASPVTQAAALSLVPILRPSAAATAMIEQRAGEIDVAALHARYLRTARSHDAQIVAGCGDPGIVRTGEIWRVDTRLGVFRAPVIVNAAGAWADEVAIAARVQPLGLRPRLRTVVLIDPPASSGHARWPIVLASDGAYYFRPFQGALLVTGGEETPSPACDAAPSALGVALAVERFARATIHPVGAKLRAKWAGLRTFTPDGAPAIGWAADTPGFFWVAGLGGFGVQASPAIGRLAAITILRLRQASTGRVRRRTQSPQPRELHREPAVPPARP